MLSIKFLPFKNRKSNATMIIPINMDNTSTIAVNLAVSCHEIHSTTLSSFMMPFIVVVIMFICYVGLIIYYSNIYCEYLVFMHDNYCLYTKYEILKTNQSFWQARPELNGELWFWRPLFYHWNYGPTSRQSFSLRTFLFEKFSNFRLSLLAVSAPFSRWNWGNRPFIKLCIFHKQILNSNCLQNHRIL